MRKAFGILSFWVDESFLWEISRLAQIYGVLLLDYIEISVTKFRGPSQIRLPEVNND